MNLRETEIASFGEKGIKIDRQLSIGDANALMAKLDGLGIASRKERAD